MAKSEIKLNRANIAKVLKSAEVQAELKRRGDRIARAAGPGNEAEAFVGATRARVTVRTATTEARVKEATGRTLTRALDAGR